MKRPSTPVFWPGEFHGLYSPWGRKESDWATFTFQRQIWSHYSEWKPSATLPCMKTATSPIRYMWPSSSHLGQSLSVPSHPSPSILQAHSRTPYLLYKLACSSVSSDCSLLPSFNRPRESSPWNLLSPQFQRVPPTIPFTPGYFLHSSAASAMYFNQTQILIFLPQCIVQVANKHSINVKGRKEQTIRRN